MNYWARCILQMLSPSMLMCLYAYMLICLIIKLALSYIFIFSLYWLFHIIPSFFMLYQLIRKIISCKWVWLNKKKKKKKNVVCYEYVSVRCDVGVSSFNHRLTPWVVVNSIWLILMIVIILCLYFTSSSAFHQCSMMYIHIFKHFKF